MFAILLGLTALASLTPGSPGPARPQAHGPRLGIPKSPPRKPGPRKGGLILPKPPLQRRPEKPPARPQPNGPAAPAEEAFREVLRGKEDVGVEELVARYRLLPAAVRDRLFVSAYRMPERALGRLARVWAAVPEERALPVLHALLRRKKLRSAARSIVESLLALSGERARAAAFELLSARRKAVRSAAEDYLASRPDPRDLDRLAALLRSPEKGVRLAALRVLGAWVEVDPKFDSTPLAEVLRSEDAGLRAEAAKRLRALGERAVPALEKLLDDRGPAFLYAGLLLAGQELRSDTDLLPAPVLARLLALRRAGPPFERAVATIVAATRWFRDPEGTARGFGRNEGGPRRVLDELIATVKVDRFYPGIAVCHESALLSLRLLTGEDFGVDALRWEAFWRDARRSFRPFRMHPPGAEALDDSFLCYREGGELRFAVAGPRADPPSPPPGRPLVFLRPQDFAALISELSARGFLNLAARLDETGDLPEVCLLDLEGSWGRCRDGFPRPASLRLQSLLGVLSTVFERERWQRFVPAGASPAERRAFFVAHEAGLRAPLEDPKRRAAILDLALENFGRLAAADRRAAIRLVRDEAASPERLFTAARARRLLAALPEVELDERALGGLLEALGRVADDGVFRGALGLLASRPGKARDLALARLFAAADAKRVALALRHPSPEIRRLAAAEAARIDDPEVAASLARAAEDRDPAVRAAAAESLAALGGAQAQAILSVLCKDPEPLVRHAAYVGLGRLGGPDAYDLLWEAASRKEGGDQLYAVKGLSLLRDPRAAEGLLKLAAAHFPEPVGLQALQGLRGRGGPTLRARLRRYLGEARSPELARELTFLLGEMQDPAVFPRILSYFASGTESVRACRILAAISGVDHCGRSDAAVLYRRWAGEHLREGPARWFLTALAAEGFKTELREDSLVPGAGPEVVAELARVLEHARSAPVRHMALYWLREVLGEDLGGLRWGAGLGARQALAERYRARALSLSRSGR